MSREIPLGVVEPDHLAAFKAFQRPPGPTELAIVADHRLTSGLAPSLDVGLGRGVYAGTQGTIDLIPGPGTLCCVVASEDGGKVVGTTATALAFNGGTHGCVSSIGPTREVTFRGVLSTKVRDLRMIDASGESRGSPATPTTPTAHRR